MSDLRPPEPRPLPPARMAARRDHLLRELRSPRRRLARRGRQALLLLPIGAVLAGGAFAATQIWQGSSPTDLVRVKCYESANVEARYRVASADIFGARGPRARPRSLERMCAALWQNGVLGDGGAAPRLSACIYRAETVVFPGPEGTCELLGLRRPRGSATRAQRRALAYVDRLAAVLEQCGDPKQIARRFERIARRAGYEPGHLEVPLRPGRDCGPALPHRDAVRAASLFGFVKGDSFMPPAFRYCRSIAKAAPGTNCWVGLGGRGAPDCPDGRQAERMVRRWLDGHGFADWRVVVVPPKSLSSRFCYVYSRVHPALREVRLSAMVDDPNR